MTHNKTSMLNYHFQPEIHRYTGKSQTRQSDKEGGFPAGICHGRVLLRERSMTTISTY